MGNVHLIRKYWVSLDTYNHSDYLEPPPRGGTSVLLSTLKIKGIMYYEQPHAVLKEGKMRGWFLNVSG